MMPDDLSPELQRFWRFYETFSPGWLDRLTEIYALDFVFVDMFAEINDHPKLRKHFAKMFDMAYSRFLVEDAAQGKDGAYVRWTWEWQMKKKHPLRRTPGVTHIRHDSAGKVVFHRDLFADGDIYEAVPLLGGLVRAVKKRVSS